VPPRYWRLIVYLHYNWPRERHSRPPRPHRGLSGVRHMTLSEILSPSPSASRGGNLPSVVPFAAQAITRANLTHFLIPCSHQHKTIQWLRLHVVSGTSGGSLTGETKHLPENDALQRSLTTVQGVSVVGAALPFSVRISLAQ